MVSWNFSAIFVVGSVRVKEVKPRNSCINTFGLSYQPQNSVCVLARLPHSFTFNSQGCLLVGRNTSHDDSNIINKIKCQKYSLHRITLRILDDLINKRRRVSLTSRLDLETSNLHSRLAKLSREWGVHPIQAT